MNFKTIIFLVLKVAAVALAVIFIVGRMKGDALSKTDFEQMKNSITSVAVLEPMQEADNQMIKRLYGIDPSLYEGVMLYYPDTNMGAEEIFLVKLKDVSQQDEVKTALDARIATQKKSFEGYGADQTAMLEKAKTIVKGNYVFYVSADDPDTVAEAFEKNY